MMGRFYLQCLSLTPWNLSVIPSSWISKMDRDIVHESSMILMKRRFANVLANMNVNSSYVGYESLPSFLSSMVLTSGLQILVMLIWKVLPWNGIISLQVQNLVNWKDII
jgi:hypothetical protein